MEGWGEGTFGHIEDLPMTGRRGTASRAGRAVANQPSGKPPKRSTPSFEVPPGDPTLPHTDGHPLATGLPLARENGDINPGSAIGDLGRATKKWAGGLKGPSPSAARPCRGAIE